jgi:hypothetical protein
MASGWDPPLRLDQTDSGCRLSLGGVAYGNGVTLQEAADDLIDRLLNMLMVVRRSGLALSGELGAPDRLVLEYVSELTEIAARGEDIRPRVFAASAVT